MSDPAPEQPTWLHRLRSHRVGLRSRILATFTLGVAALAVVLAFTTYGLTRSTLLRQREDTALRQAYSDARGVRAILRSNPTSAKAALDGVSDVGPAEPLLRYRGAWANTSPKFTPDSLPAELQRRVIDEQTRGADALLRRPTAHGRGHPAPRRRCELLRGRAPRRAVPHARQRPGVAARRGRHHDRARRPPRGTGRPAGRAAPGRRRAGRAGHRRRRTRHPAGAGRRPRSPGAGRVVQRHGVRAAAAGRARRPVRVRRQPRAPVAPHHARRLGRGAQQPPRRAAREGGRGGRPDRGRRRAASRTWSRTCWRSPASMPAPCA